MGPASLKTSPPLGAPFVRKRVQAFFAKKKMRESRGEVTFTYSSVEATSLQLYVEPTQIVDVQGMSGCFTFTVYQKK